MAKNAVKAMIERPEEEGLAASPRKPAMPLATWMEGGRQRAARRRRLRRRACLMVAGLIAGPMALGGTLLLPPAPRLLWNVSASAPVGLYLVEPASLPARDDLVIAWPPETVRRLAAGRNYLPANVPLVKRVAAVQGDLVCARGTRIAINGVTVATRRAVDGSGRSLPQWQGCFRLGQGAYFLLMREHADSFDGRYFGAVGAGNIVGRARLLWAR